MDESTEELFEDAPCGYVSTLADGRLVRVNRTFEGWIGLPREALLGRRFQDLLTAGGRIYHETHYAPLLRMQGSVREIALDLVRSDGSRLPVLVNSVMRTGEDGEPLGVRTIIFDATHRRSYERELLAALEHDRAVAHALQQSMLGGEPPDDGRYDVATYYSPAGETIEVGGDWYDTFRIGAATIGVSVGDVAGRGLDAATAMGQLRSATRALAGAELGPAGVLDRLETFAEQLPSARMATVAYGELDLSTGAMRFACAGHPPPILVSRGGRADIVWEGRSAPLGAYLGDRPPAESTLPLGPGSRLVLYTDGLIERRDRTLDEGLALMQSALEPRAGAPLAEMVGGLVEALVGAGAVDDDVCVLCVEYLGSEGSPGA